MAFLFILFVGFAVAVGLCDVLGINTSYLFCSSIPFASLTCQQWHSAVGSLEVCPQADYICLSGRVLFCQFMQRPHIIVIW
jgi:hypothetical protein